MAGYNRIAAQAFGGPEILEHVPQLLREKVRTPMQKKSYLLMLALGFVACGNTNGEAETGPVAESKPPEGYTRYKSESIEVEPGQDITLCQFVTEPAEEDIDLVDISGNQGFPGHHAVLYATSAKGPVGTMRPCTSEDQIQTKHLGGVGGEGAGSSFPEGASVRVRKGQSLMMNVHYLNSSTKKATGHSYIDAKFVPPAPGRPQASLLNNVTIKYSLAPYKETTAEAKCVLPRDIKAVNIRNHMHEFGVKIRTELIHADGTVEDLKTDETWLYEWQFNPPARSWTVNEPRILKAGDTLHTICTWKNTSLETLTYPREMCIAATYILADKDVACFEGMWYE